MSTKNLHQEQSTLLTRIFTVLYRRYAMQGTASKMVKPVQASWVKPRTDAGHLA